MQTKQKGFGVVEGILVLIILLLFGFIGWDIYYTYTKPKPATPSATATTTVPTASSPEAAVACAAIDLKFSVGDVNGTAGTFYRDAIFTNTSNHACTLNGYAKVILASTSHQQLGQQAEDSGPVQTTPVTIQPNDTAHASIGFPDPGVFDSSSACSQTSTYIDVTIPGSTTPFESPVAQKYCPGFLVQAFAAGN